MVPGGNTLQEVKELLLGGPGRLLGEAVAERVRRGGHRAVLAQVESDVCIEFPGSPPKTGQEATRLRSIGWKVT